MLRTALPCTLPPPVLQRRRRITATRSMSASPVAAAGSGAYRVVRADLHDARHAAAFTACTQAYACDAMGGGKPLSDAVLARSAAALADWPTALVLLAFENASDDAAGVATCFRGWSTFQGAPLLNVHDLAVAPAHRRRGVGRLLLQAVKDEAMATGCSKVTLEALAHNAPAQALYHELGFTFQMQFGELKLMDVPRAA